MARLRRAMFGNPILRTSARRLTAEEILSEDMQRLIQEMRDLLAGRKHGVGLAAPQVGQSVAVSVIGIKPTPNHPDTTAVDMVIINPEIVRTYGRKTGMWEGCISFGSGPAAPYAQAMRSPKVRVRYLDEQAVQHEADYDGLMAHVLQHEIDHINGVLFVDRVSDTKTYMTMGEYKKHIKKNDR